VYRTLIDIDEYPVINVFVFDIILTDVLLTIYTVRLYVSFQEPHPLIVAAKILLEFETVIA
jgi:hypothetical protein